MRSGRNGRVMRGVCALAIAVMLSGHATMAFAAGAVAPMSQDAIAAASPDLLPRAVAPLGTSGVRTGESLGVPGQGVDEFIARAGFLPVELSAQVTASDVAIPFGGFYYWVGTTLVVDGWVKNDTAADVGRIGVGIVVKNSAGVDVATTAVAAAAYNVAPGESAVFQARITDVASYAGQDMGVLVSTLARQPAEFPDAVELTLLQGEYVVQPDGSRKYNITFRNDSGIDTWMPVIGGLELDSANEPQAALFGYHPDVRIPNGATVVLNAWAIAPGITPTMTAVYAQAVPSPPSQPIAIHRFYNMRNGSHFYTPSAEEYEYVSATLGAIYRYEGVAYYTDAATNTQPLYRFFYKRGGTHFYTADREEASLIMLRWPNVFTFEGMSYSVSRQDTPGALTVYRFINRRNSSHFYTSDPGERDFVKSALTGTYTYEGPSFYIAP